MTFTISCIIHCRVSTGRQAYEGESLEMQERICRDIADRNGWRIAHDPWLEAYSGRKHARQAFADVLRYLDQHPGEVRFYVFRAIDRFTRGGVLMYAHMKAELAKRGVELVDSMGVIQPTRNTLEHVGFEYEWSRVSPSEITEVVMATTAKAEINTILTRLIGQEIALTQQGYKVRGAPDGFKNQRTHIGGKRRTVLVPDAERARFITAMYELRAAGQLSDTEIVNRVNAMGYRRPEFNRWDASHTRIIGKGGGGLLVPKRLQEIIRRPIYCGVVWEKWTNWRAVKARYDGLVSIELWNAANRGLRHIRQTEHDIVLRHDFDPALVGKRISRANPDYPFKNVIRCPACSMPFMGSASRGKDGRRFPAYHCSRRHPRIARSKSAFEQAVRSCIDQLYFMPGAAALARQFVTQRFAEHLSDRNAAAMEIQRGITDLETERLETIRAFKMAASDAMRDALEAELVRLDDAIARANVQRTETQITDAEVGSYIHAVAEIIEHPSILLEAPGNSRVQQARYARIFAELPTLAEIEAGTPKLTPIFRVLVGQRQAKSGLVRLRGLSWNTIKKDIERWKNPNT